MDTVIKSGQGARLGRVLMQDLEVQLVRPPVTVRLGANGGLAAMLEGTFAFA
ncbi:hypothetical protein [Dickeya zeae]|uniref:hypothetical protein n=1 Tax=Dickeya zeae TaxID=204042 RepID=UPI001C62B94C|nr:hypothetical protein [Dickeya zeae]